MDNRDNIIEKQDELMSCPFCGCVAIIIEPYHKGKHNGWHLYCNGCHLGYTQLVIHNTLEWLREKMISKWNTRAYKSIAELSRLRESKDGIESSQSTDTPQYRKVPFELSEETWKKLTPIERMKFKGLLLEKIPVEPDKKSADFTDEDMNHAITGE